MGISEELIPSVPVELSRPGSRPGLGPRYGGLNPSKLPPDGVTPGLLGNDWATPVNPALKAASVSVPVSAFAEGSDDEFWPSLYLSKADCRGLAGGKLPIPPVALSKLLPKVVS